MPLPSRSALFALLILAASRLQAQTAPLTTADSNLVYRILTAEDRRDSLAPALGEGTRHGDERIRQLALRARARITDSLYAARAEGPALAPRVTWPLPAWRLRYDSLRLVRNDCAALGAALGDPIIQVRLRAIDLLPAACHTDSTVIATAQAWVARLAGPSGTLFWHEGAHALVALARLRPVQGHGEVVRASKHPTWQVRMYAVRAAQELHDTAFLVGRVRDQNGNVAEAAIEAMSAESGHHYDPAYLLALRSGKPEVVRAAAIALKGTSRADAATAASAVYTRWRARRHDSERDVRLALLDLMGKPASDDVAPRPPAPLPREVVALALGARQDLIVQVGDRLEDTFVVRLRGDVAPISAARVLQLVDRRRYDGTTWHRVIPDFVIQGGSADANEYVGGDRFFRDEHPLAPARRRRNEHPRARYR